MTNLEKVTALLNDLHTNHDILTRTERLELKLNRTGHWRLFAAMITGTEARHADGVDAIAEAHRYTANPYRRGQALGSISFADQDEPVKQSR